MNVLAVGDSFTYGDELSDRTLSWPHLLADRFKWKLTNMAKPASGNSRMVRYIVENVSKFDAVLIGWSHFARTEFADDHGFFDIWPGGSPRAFREGTPWRSELVEYYNRNHDDHYMYRQYLLNIVLIQNFLKQHDKKYIMLDAFGNHQHQERKLQKNKDLIKQIDTTWFVGWPNESMQEWTWGCEQGIEGHFLQTGHIRVAEKIYAHMEKVKWHA